MDGNNWRPAQAGEPNPGMDSGDWRTQLSHDSRQRIVNKILDTLKKHLPISGPEGLGELQKIAVRFEEKIYTAATSQTDYLRRISVKMLTMETKSQAGMANSSGGVNQNSSDPASNTMQPQVRNQGQQQLPMSMVNQSQAHQQVLPQNNIASAVVQNSGSLQSAMPSITGLTQTAMSNVVGQNPNLPSNIGGIAQNSNSNSLVGQGVQPNVFSNSQRQQLQGRQQQSQNPQQQYNMYQQQQLHNQLLKQKMQQQQQGTMQSSLLHSHLQQQQSSLLQPNQLQGSQQSLMQMSSGLPSSQAMQQPSPSMLQTVQQSSLQQNQQAAPSVLHQHQQSLLRQQQQSQQSSVHQQMLPSQQQQLLGQQSSAHGSQQMIGQTHTGVQDMQQQRLLGPQNNLSNLQLSQQPAMLGQQTSISSLNQQQQLNVQNNVSGVQQQLTHQGNMSNIQQHQNSMHMIQQAKVVAAPQQSNQQASSTMLPSQGQQQSQSLTQQQQFMSQLQSQSAQLQSQMTLQQQQPNSIQMQQRMQTSNTLLQPQSTIEQQKQHLFQSQRGLPEASSTSMDSTAQTGHNSVDWQEEIYQKIKSMKDMYYMDLNELYQKISMRYQQHDGLAQGPKQSEQVEKIRMFRSMIERMLHILALPKSGIQPSLKEKLAGFEKQMINVLNSNRTKKPTPLIQQGQQPLPPSGGSSLPSMSQQTGLQITQLQQHDSHMSQMQPISLQSSVSTGMSMPLSTNMGAPHAQQSMLNSMQPAQNLDQAHGNAMVSSQQNVIGSLQQNSVNGTQQAGMNILSQGGVNLLQPNINNLQSNSNMLQQQQHLKQQQEQHKQQQQQQQQMMQNQQLKQQFQQRHMHPQIIQQQQKQHLMLQQQQLQQQQLHQQPQSKQQIPQLHQMNNEVNDLKMRQGAGLIKSGMFPQHLQHGQRPPYHQQPLKTGGPFPISSPQLLQSQSPQISQHSSPQIDQQNLLTTLSKTGTPMQSANSPFVPSPSTPSMAPSPIPGDPEKPTSGISSIANAGNVGSQQMGPTLTQAQSLAIGTPGMSASPLLAEYTGADGNQGNAAVIGKSNATERPIERLLKVMKSMSSEAFRSAVSDIHSVVSMVDRIAGSAPGNGSRAAVGEDLVAMTKCRLQARNFMPSDGSAANVTKKMRRDTSATPLNAVSSAGSVNIDNFRQVSSLEASDLESTATSTIKKHKVEANHSLIEEIKEINQRLIDTVVEVSDENIDSVAGSAEGEGTIVKCSYTAIAISPSLRSQFVAAQMSPIMPLRLLVPANYPNCSPVLLDKLLVEPSKEMEDLSVKAKSKFSISLRGLSHPMSLGEIARTWDACARQVIAEYAQQSGGGSFSSCYGTWESCVSG